MATAVSAPAAADQVAAALGPRSRGRPRKHAVADMVTAAAADQLAALGPRRRGRPPKDPVAAEVPGRPPASPLLEPAGAVEAEAGGEYERERAARIRENMKRMQKLGILDLAQTLAQSAAAARTRHRNPVEPGCVAATRVKPAPRAPSRRSLRLVLTAADVLPAESLHLLFLVLATPVAFFPLYSLHHTLAVSMLKSVEPVSYCEIYTEEHEKLLGTCDTPWTLFMDSFGKDGKRIYDQVSGQTCHQCRQKTLGHRTSCCKCQIVQGQFCGDCLYMRYGENVLEAKKNPNWICPVCRGICNCSICRTKKGWFPTGPVYRKVVKLGYKSVAHYLIATQRASANSEDSSTAELNKTPSKSETSCISDHDGLVTKDSLEDGETSSKAKQNKAPCHEAKNPDGCKDNNSTSESVVTSDSQNDQASKDAGCVTRVSKPTSRKRRYAEPSADCVASRLRSRCKLL
ncbi:hypothetical protein U9M48_002265 [Paspalum notatum var. saurae]|uniref:Zinc-finger domain-containing protein n=1 Tax=Paspalum notatum var. saurae TaxID=547442 RepID=A0AAQ3PJI5_PASNO